VLVQGYPLSSILFNLFINDILNKCDKYGISISDKHWCGGLFTDGIMLCAPIRSVSVLNHFKTVHLGKYGDSF